MAQLNSPPIEKGVVLSMQEDDIWIVSSIVLMFSKQRVCERFLTRTFLSCEYLGT